TARARCSRCGRRIRSGCSPRPRASVSEHRLGGMASMDNNLEMSLLAIQSDLSGLVSKATTLRTLSQRAQAEADAALAYSAAAEEASALLMGISDGRTNALAQFLGGLVTEALRAIFDDVEGLTFVVSTRVL